MPDVFANVPMSVTVAFPREDSGVASGSFFTIEVAGIGHLGTQLVHSTCVAEFEGGADPVNLLELQNLANQIASDWYAWREAPLEMRYESAVPWTVEGMHDVEYLHDTGISTSIHRSTWEPDAGWYGHAGTYGSTFKPGVGMVFVNFQVAVGVITIIEQINIISVVRIDVGVYQITFPYIGLFIWILSLGYEPLYWYEDSRGPNWVIIKIEDLTSPGTKKDPGVVNVHIVSKKTECCDKKLPGGAGGGPGDFFNLVPIDTDYTPIHGNFLRGDTSGGSITIQTPTAEKDSYFWVQKATGDTNPIFIEPATGTINGTTKYEITKQNETAYFIYDEATTDWIPAQQSSADTVKKSPAAATTEPLPTVTYDNGNKGIGAKLTKSSNGAIGPIDGIPIKKGDLILVKNQEDEKQNGFYFVEKTGDAGTPFVLIRDPSMDSATKFPGSKIFLPQGDVNGCKTFKFSGPTPDPDLATPLRFFEELPFKTPAKMGTTEPLPSVTYNAAVPDTLTATSNGVIPDIDGITPVVGDVVYVKDQATPLQNGLYIVKDIGSVSTPFILVRDPSMTYGSQFPGAMIPILSGDTNAGSVWAVSNSTPPTVGTTGITSAISGGISTYFGGGSSITAASTTDLGTVSGIAVTVTGNTGITDLGTLPSGVPPFKFLTFTGTPTLTNSSGLVLPGAANIPVAAGDTALVIYDAGSGNWTMADYTRAGSGSLAPETTTSLAALFSSFTDVILTGTVAITSTAMADVTGFSFSVDANTKYVVEFVLHIANGVHFDFQLTGPSSPTGVLMTVDQDNQTPQAVTAFSSPTGFAGAPLSDFVVYIKAIIRNGANAGTVKLQAALTTGSTSQNINANSWMSVRKSS